MSSVRDKALRIFRPLPLLVLLANLAISTPTEGAAPWVLMIYGEPLPHPVILTNWVENHRFMLAVAKDAEISDGQLAGRPYLNLALFWGPDWVGYANDSKAAGKLRPEQANQRGRFYPAVGELAPIVTLDQGLGRGYTRRRVDQEGIKILARHGISVTSNPCSLEQKPR